MLFEILSISFLTLYSIAVFYAWFTWKKIPISNSISEKSATKFSIIIPFRNEQSNLEGILKSILNLNYPPHLFEVLLVDDHSSDNFISKINGFLSVFPSAKLLVSKSNGKKAAISYAISQSKYDCIVTFDADCNLPADILHAYSSKFDDGYDFITGPVAMSENNFWQIFQAQEFATLIGIGAVTLSWGYPSMANGANLAYKKAVFNHVGGFLGNESIPTGDDEFLLKKVFKKFKVSFLKNKSAVVETAPNKYFSDFLNQKIRWASKWRYNNPLVPTFLFILNCIIIASVVLIICGKMNSTPFAISFAIKALVDFIYIKSVQHFLNQKFSIVSFLIWQLVYPFYIIVIGILANVKAYNWKGRKYRINGN